MREIEGDLWETAGAIGANAVVITTNGYMKRNGEAVMGRGVARQASQRWPTLPRFLGEHLIRVGNRVYDLGADWDMGDRSLVAFPVKHNWYEKADLELIKRSAQELAALAGRRDWAIVVLPRPGCGNGKLDWAEVRPILEKHLDDRFVVVHREVSDG